MDIHSQGTQDFPVNEERAKYWKKRYELVF